MTLLNSSVNIEISNKKFDDKKNHYTASKIEENIEIAKKKKWDLSEIESRQSELCKIALKLWKK